MLSSVVSTAPAASVPRKRPGCPGRARPHTTWNSTSSFKGEDPHSSPFGSGHLPPWGPHCFCTFKCYLCANDCPDQICSSDFALQRQTQASKCRQHCMDTRAARKPWPGPDHRYSHSRTCISAQLPSSSWSPKAPSPEPSSYLLGHPAPNQSPGPVSAPCAMLLPEVVGLYLCICISFFEEITHSRGSQLRESYRLDRAVSPLCLSAHFRNSHRRCVHLQRKRNTCSPPHPFYTNGNVLYTTLLLIFVIFPFYVSWWSFQSRTKKTSCICFYGLIVFQWAEDSILCNQFPR